MKPKEIVGSRYGTFLKILLDKKVKTGAEIGVDKGHYSKFLLHNIPGLILYSIDAWEVFSGCTHGETQKKMDRQYQSALLRLVNYPTVRIVRALSMDAVKMFKDESLDFVYIDAAHDYKSVSEDIREWSKKVKLGGIVAGHDYTNPIADRSLGYYREVYDVKRAVNEWVKKNKIQLNLLTKCTSWFYIK